MKTFKRALTWSVVVTTIAWSVGASLLVAPLAAGATATITAGSLIKGSLPAVYYYGGDGKRYVFPNEATYKTWYADFSGVQTITDADLAAITIGGNVTYKPGVKMVKITTDPKVYAVDAHGTLRHIASETVAVALYGASWAGLVNDVPDAFFVNYTVGTAIAAAADFGTAAVVAAATSINVDKNLSGTVVTPTPVTGTVTVSDGGSPAAASIPLSSTNVIFAKVKLVGTGTVTGLKVTRSGLGADASFTGVKLFDGTTQLGTTQTLNAVHQASFTGLSVAVAGEKILTIAGEITAAAAHAGEILVLSVASAADVTLSSGTVGGTFPITGNGMTLVNLASGIGTASLYRGADMPTSNTSPPPDSADFRFTQVRILAGSVEDITIKQLTAIQSGTATTADLKDVKLYNDTASKVEGTIATLASNGRAVYDNLNIVIKKGESLNLSIKATLTGNPSNRTVGFELHDGVAYTIQIVGNTYGFGITPARVAGTGGFCSTAGVSSISGVAQTYNAADGATGACATQTVAQGTLRLNRATSSPATGKIAQGGTAIPLLAVEFNVTGEPISITSQNYDFTFATNVADASANTFCSTTGHLTSVGLYDKDGGLVAGPKDCASNAVTFTETMVVPVGTSTYTLKGNISSSAVANNTALATLDVSEFTVKGVNSGKATTVSTTADVAGNTLTVQGGALSSTTGATPIAGSVVKGVQDFTFANVTLDASAGGEDVKITALVVADATGTAAIPGDLVNWELWGDPDTSDAVNSIVRIDTSNSTAAATYTANTAGIDSTVTFTFSTPLRISKNKSVSLAVKADVISGATTGTDTTFAHQVDLSTVSATGWTTGGTVASTPAGTGQTQILRATGTLKVELAADTATAGPIVAGSTGVSTVKYKLTSAFEDVDITELPLYLANGAVAAGTLANVAKVKVYKSGTQIGNLAGYEFNNSAQVTVTLDSGVLRVVKDVSLYLELKADFNAKEQVASATQARIGIGDSDSDASTWGTTRAGAAGNYNITANGRDSGTTVTKANIDSVGDGNGNVAGGDAFGVFDGVLTTGLDSSSPTGTQTVGTLKEVLRFWLTATGDEITVYNLSFVSGGTANTEAGTATLESSDGLTTYASFASADWGDNASFSVLADDSDLAFDTTLVVGAGVTKTLRLKLNTTGALTNTTFQASVQGGTQAATVTGSGVAWYDVETQGYNGTCTTPAATYDVGAECVVDSTTYTKTLPVSGNGLSY